MDAWSYTSKISLKLVGPEWFVVKSHIRIHRCGNYFELNFPTFCTHIIIEESKKSSKIPKGQSESVYGRRTDNTMAKKKMTKGQTTFYKTYI
jgi:hypothetical protein